MSNKWNPGCCDCGCTQCTDYYYPPNDWYVWPENFAASQYNSGSYFNGGSGAYITPQYYWDATDLHDVLNALVATFQFPGTEPSSTLGSASVYAFPAAFFASVVAYGTVYMRHHDLFGTPSAWTSRDIEFSNFALANGEIYDCNGRRVLFDIECEIYEPHSGSTQYGRFRFGTADVPVLGALQPCSTKPLMHDTVVTAKMSTGSNVFDVTYLSGNFFAVMFPLYVASLAAGGPYYQGEGYVDTAPP